jgi:hypothetical protein
MICWHWHFHHRLVAPALTTHPPPFFFWYWGLNSRPHTFIFQIGLKNNSQFCPRPALDHNLPTYTSHIARITEQVHGTMPRLFIEMGFH